MVAKNVVFFRCEHIFRICTEDEKQIMVYITGSRPDDGNKITKCSITSGQIGMPMDFTFDMSDRGELESALNRYLKEQGLQLKQIVSESRTLYLTMQFKGDGHVVYAGFEGEAGRGISDFHCMMDGLLNVYRNGSVKVDMSDHKSMMRYVKRFCALKVAH